ncbi:solute carrier family 35 [Capsaspora owczarzaki ATCC 30864]|uniref:Solute carrier family 35 n=1 Tax=Capsaspora owczarzaki (strain ATCC 30864) TaxID=595528 RepID=A0A0D2WIM4_CAPO3|nr:solute carrier family 35 [Capsaspora owczarzaki ATCC 30864]KJE88933.1 solute carrier family 35 [Capsaspora owczarzaki ATCC 30864]|eukprot:XP_004365372.1 solute carrier family 35 [Capsaspora owczarzaki ATCC 30864]
MEQQQQQQHRHMGHMGLAHLPAGQRGSRERINLTGLVHDTASDGSSSAGGQSIAIGMPSIHNNININNISGSGNIGSGSSSSSGGGSSSSSSAHSGPSRREQIGTALFYAVSSLLIIFVNKIVLTTYGFPSFMGVALGQFVATIVTLQVLKALGKVTFPDLSMHVAKMTFPLPLLFFLNTASGLGGTKLTSLPMLTVLRRFSIFMTMVLEYYILGVSSTPKVKLSVGLLIGGALIAAADDLAFDPFGYFMVTVNNLCTALSGVVLKKKLDSKELGTIGLLYYNSLFSLPFCFAYFFLFAPAEWNAMLQFQGWGDAGFQFQFLLSSVMGLILNYSIFLCTKANSPLTTTVVGCLKNILTTYLGMFLGGDYIFSMANFVGLNISVSGSVYYSYVKFIEEAPKARPAK